MTSPIRAARRRKARVIEREASRDPKLSSLPRKFRRALVREVAKRDGKP